MKLNLKNLPILPEILRRARTGQPSASPCAKPVTLSARRRPLVRQAGDALQAWSEHPQPAVPEPPSFDI